jgi:hypothetical protein
MEVKNNPSTPNKECNCENWLKHWLKSQNKEELPECSVYNCTNEAVVGGHVSLHEDTKSIVYVVPLCLYHNSIQHQKMALIQDVELIEPKILSTCDHKT